jgi:CRISPR/Cas system-associated exonuclease Cas4 (RecB family)
MYQLGTKWKLWNLQQLSQEIIDSISPLYRGYNLESPISLAADFSYVEEGVRPLSVEQIAHNECFTRRDLYLFKRNQVKRKDAITWGRIAGILIDDFCKGLTVYFHDLAEHPEGLNYQKIEEFAQQYTDKFREDHKRQLNGLELIAKKEEEQPEYLSYLLKQTAKYELMMIGADFYSSQIPGQRFIPLTQSRLIHFDELSVQIHPNPLLGISDNNTPDFMITDDPIVIGEIKSGNILMPHHLHTIAGYALAYESEHHSDVNIGDVNIGIVYFFQTHSISRERNFAQCYFFVISDILRKGFLASREQAYSALLEDNPPKLLRETSEELYKSTCTHCKYFGYCYPTNGKN